MLHSRATSGGLYLIPLKCPMHHSHWFCWLWFTWSESTSMSDKLRKRQCNAQLLWHWSGEYITKKRGVSVWLDFYPKWKLCSRWDFCDIRLPNLGQGHKGNSPHAPLDIPLGLLRVTIHSAVQRNLPKRGGNDVKRSPYWWLSPSYPN